MSTNNDLYEDLQRNEIISLKNNNNNLENLNSSLYIINQSQSSSNLNNKKGVQRFKLLTEGDVHVCKLAHSRNVISKILSSKLLRRWKAHRLVLADTEIYSTTVNNYLFIYLSFPFYPIY